MAVFCPIVNDGLYPSQKNTISGQNTIFKFRVFAKNIIRRTMSNYINTMSDKVRLSIDIDFHFSHGPFLNKTV